MPQRITKAHIDAELLKLIRTAERLGIKDTSETWQVIRGKRHLGEPWRVVVWPFDSASRGSWVDFLPKGIIGDTAPEALNNLKMIRLAWEYFYQKGK